MRIFQKRPIIYIKQTAKDGIILDIGSKTRKIGKIKYSAQKESIVRVMRITQIMREDSSRDDVEVRREKRLDVWTV